MAINENHTNDPYPWAHVDYDGSESRVASAQDENGEIWRHWVFAPRPKSVWEKVS
jgi:hypothetical protein